MERVNIIGAGLGGLSAAVTLAGHGLACRLISLQHSERAQSVLAEGGINAALDTMGEHDTVQEHYKDTMAGGVWLADPEAVQGLTENAPEIVRWLVSIGVPFHMEEGKLLLRNFGGQKKKRTAYAKSSTGKMIVQALTDEVRKYEAKGSITRYPHHEFIRLLLRGAEGDRRCSGVRICDTYSGRLFDLAGPVILACGGMNGIFPDRTTGTTGNSGDVTATVFSQGVVLSNLEMLQYHPTTIGIPGKRCLVTEAARGEGGRLYITRNGEPWYFMEEKYPELKNLMPRDVVSREMFFVSHRPDCGRQVYLDMTGLSGAVWQKKLTDLREEIRYYLGLDPAARPVPVEPGIHYFMGGMDTDVCHRTNIRNLYAAGECSSQYHGANRLGGNSMLGAVYGGRVSAKQILLEIKPGQSDPDEGVTECSDDVSEPLTEAVSDVFAKQLGDILAEGLGIVRSGQRMCGALEKLEGLEAHTLRERNRLLLAEAMLGSALLREESRGAHYREDFPERSEAFQKIITARCLDGSVCFDFKKPSPQKGDGRA